MHPDELLRRRTEAALLARPFACPTEIPRDSAAGKAVELPHSPIDDAYDVVQSMLLALYREVSAHRYADMQLAAREQYHRKMAEHFHGHAALEPRLAAYFAARAVLHDQCAKLIVAQGKGQGEALARDLDCNVMLEVLGLTNSPA